MKLEATWEGQLWTEELSQKPWWATLPASPHSRSSVLRGPLAGAGPLTSAPHWVSAVGNDRGGRGVSGVGQGCSSLGPFLVGRSIMAPPGCSFLSSSSPLTLALSRCGDPLLLTPGHSPNLSLSFTQGQPQVRPTAPRHPTSIHHFECVASFQDSAWSTCR